MSQELRRGELRLWRGEQVRDENSKVINSTNPGGLYPAPLGKSVKKNVLNQSLQKFRVREIRIMNLLIKMFTVVTGTMHGPIAQRLPND